MPSADEEAGKSAPRVFDEEDYDILLPRVEDDSGESQENLIDDDQLLELLKETTPLSNNSILEQTASVKRPKLEVPPSPAPKRRKKVTKNSEPPVEQVQEAGDDLAATVATCGTDEQGNAVVSASVPALCGTLLELHLQKRQVVDSLFDVVDAMFFAPLPQGGVDELYFNWILQNSSKAGSIRYADFATNRPRGEASSLRRTMCIALKKAAKVDSLSLEVIAHSDRVGDAELQTASHESQHEEHAQVESQHETSNESSYCVKDLLNNWLERDKTKEVENATSNFKHLDFLCSPAVEFSSIAQWSPREIAIFQLALCTYGQDFGEISNCIRTKTYKESYNFYTETFKQVST